MSHTPLDDDTDAYADVDDIDESTTEDPSTAQSSSRRGLQEVTRTVRDDSQEEDTLDYLFHKFKKLRADRFGWTTCKSLLVFVIALQYLDQLKHMSIPLKNYCPFDK